MSPYRQYKRTDPRRYQVHLELALGRRGTALTVLGFIWILQGVGVAMAPGAQQYLLLSGPPWWHAVRATGWILSGLIAIICAPRKQGRDTYGFVALYAMAAVRIVAYAHGFLDYFDKGHGRDGDLRGIIGVISWAGFAFLIHLIAGWREDVTIRAAGDTKDTK